MRFTDRTIAALKPRPGCQYEKRDDTRLTIRISPGGTKTWMLVYERDGRKRRLKLGNFPAMSTCAARQSASAALSNVAMGRDAASAVETPVHVDLAEMTFGELAERYLERWAKARKRSWKDDERRLAKHVLPEWGERIASDVRRRDVLDLLEGLADQGLTTGANRVLAVVRRVFNWALEQDLLENSPCHRVRAPALERSRDRVLSPSELRRLWNGLDKCHMFPSTRTAIRLQLATALRIGEVVRAAWAEIDLESGWWTIPAARSKNKLAHRVPLTDLSLELLREQHRESGSTEWVFPNPRNTAPITTQAVSKALHRSRDLLGFGEPFVPHDLRRTAASMMVGQGVSRTVVGKVLNHVERGVTAIYDRHGYDREKREALEAWAAEIRRMVDAGDST